MKALVPLTLLMTLASSAPRQSIYRQPSFYLSKTRGARDSAGATRAPAYPNPQPTYGGYPEQPARYEFEWQVQDDYTGNDYGHKENRDDKVTKGQYFVLLPDGRRQKVTYTVDAYNGYQAEVTYEGEAQYPPQQPSSYGKPQTYPKPAPAPKTYGPSTTPKSYSQPSPKVYSYKPAPTSKPYSPAPAPTSISYAPSPSPSYAPQTPAPSVRRYSYKPAPSNIVEDQTAEETQESVSVKIQESGDEVAGGYQSQEAEEQVVEEQAPANPNAYEVYYKYI